MDRKTADFFNHLHKEKAKRARKRPRTEEIVPDVLIYNVGRFLGVKELGRMMQVSQQFNRVIGNSADLWNRHYESMLDDENQKHLPIGDAVKGYERLRMAKAWAKKGFLRTRAKFRTNVEISKKKRKNNENATNNMINMISTKDLLIMVMNNKLYEYPKKNLRTHVVFTPKMIADIGKGFSKKFSSLAYCSKSKILFSGFDNGEVGVAKLSGKGGRGFMQKIIGEEINSVSCVERNYCVTSTEKLNIFKLNEKGDWLDSLLSLDNQMRIKKAKFSPNGEKLGVTLAEGYLAVYDIESCESDLTQTRMLNNAHSFGECEFFSDHEILTTRGNTVRLYDLRMKELSKKYETVNPYENNTAARKIFELTCMSHTSFGLMAGSTTGDVFLWDHRNPSIHIRKWNIANELGLQSRRNHLQCSNLVISSIGMDVYGAYFISPYSLNWIDI